MIRIIHLFILSLTFSLSYSQAGTPDNAFGNNGKVTTHFADIDQITGMVIQPDGKIIVAGYSYNGSDADFAIARYNTNGILDATFDGDGKLTIGFGTFPDLGRAIALQPDGKILVAGTTNTGANADFALIRLNADGTLDATFDGDGKVTTPIGPASDAAYAMVIQPDGKIIVAGSSSNGSNNDFGIVRYNTNGSLDNTFDGDGKVTTPIGPSFEVIYGITLQSDGKIVVAGASTNGSNWDFALARYNTNGSLDNTFDVDGILTTPIGANNDFGHTVIIQPDGKILVAGATHNGSNFDFGVARYNTDGSPDATFDGDGKLSTAIGTLNDEPYGIALQPNGKIVVAGYSNNGTDEDFAIVRYTTSGALDATFDGDGKATLDFGASDKGFAMKLSGSRIYVGGFSTINGDEDFALAAFTNDASSLPLSLTSFSAVKNNSIITLNWRTVFEQNTSSFLIERSFDSRNFSMIGTLGAAGNSTSEELYSFQDDLSGVSSQSTIVFYRLRTIDLDKRENLSNVVIVKISAGKKFGVFPNPASNVLQLQTAAIGTFNVQIRDASGRMVKSLELTSTSGILTTTIDISSLQKGTYFLKVDGEVIKFMKQ